MCGFAGLVNTREGVTDADVALVERMSELLSHRGPDAAAYEFDRMCFGHRRLSIIDIEGGQQPMWDASRRVCIIYNGEIYNFKELKSELIGSGKTFTTNSDTEVLLQSYLHYGKACVEHFNGMFAFAIWDSNKNELFLARDRLGEKPLYFSVNEGRIVFASELKALAKSNAVSCDVDSDALGCYFNLGYVPAPLSIFKGVQKLSPGEWASWSPGDGDVQRHRYWIPSNLAPSQQPAPTLDQLENLIRAAVSIRLRSDVPVGCFLSGGIDSSLIASYARDEYGPGLQTFCIKFAETGADESAYARQVARQLGTSHHEIEVADFNLDILPALVEQFDEPFADPSSLPTYYVTKAASNHLKVCLSGDGGDEIFGGYTRYQPEHLEAIVDRLPARFRRLAYDLTFRHLHESARGKGWVRRLASTQCDRFLLKVALFAPEELELLLPDSVASMRHANKDHVKLAQYLHANREDWRLIFDQMTYLPEDILVKVDRTSMLNSLEVRVPLLDHNLVEIANISPLAWRMTGTKLKQPLKELARRRFPAGITERQKHGFGLPLKDWFATGVLADQFSDLVLQPNSKVSNYINVDELRRFHRAHVSGKRDFGRKLWGLLWLEIWMRQFSS